MKRDKAQCSVCHHRADKHYEGRCHHARGGGLCGCAGVHAAADGDAKKGGKKPRREKVR